MKNLRGRFVRATFLFMLMVTAFFISRTCLFAVNASDEASSAIGEADNALKHAFNAVLEAERAGANVSDLIVKLSEAGGLLAEAENAYRVGNFSEAAGKAKACSTMAHDIAWKAFILKSSALADAQKAFLQTLTFSCLGCTVFLAFLYLVWCWFRRVYEEKLLKMRPEVAADAED